MWLKEILEKIERNHRVTKIHLLEGKGHKIISNLRRFNGNYLDILMAVDIKAFSKGVSEIYHLIAAILFKLNLSNWLSLIKSVLPNNNERIWYSTTRANQILKISLMNFELTIIFFEKSS